MQVIALQHAINPMTVSKTYSLMEVRGLLLPLLTQASQLARQLGIDVVALTAFVQALRVACHESNLRSALHI